MYCCRKSGQGLFKGGPTRAPTEQFFKQHSYFGLDEQNVIFFEQGEREIVYGLDNNKPPSDS